MEEKLFYTIGEASKYVDVKPYVLRYWETEFRKLNPQKSVTGQRTYRKKDIQMALTIRRLLYEEKYTIAGAIQKLEELEKEGLDPFVPTAEENASEIENVPARNAETVEEKTNVEKRTEESGNADGPVGKELKSKSPSYSPEKVKELFKLITESKNILGKYPLA